MTNRLEDSYRRLLSAYPPEFRAQHGEELLGVLLSAAPDSQTRPGFRDAVDLLWNGVVLRSRRLFGAIPVKLLERVGLLSLAGGTALSALCLYRGELGARDVSDHGISVQWVHVYSTGSALYLLWLLLVALLVAGVVKNVRRATLALAVCTALLALASQVVPAGAVTEPPMFLIALFAGLATLSLGLPRTLAPRTRTLLGSGSLVSSLALVTLSANDSGGYWFYRVALRDVASSLVWLGVIALGVGGGLASVRRPGWILATAIASIPWVCFALLFVVRNGPHAEPAMLFLGVVTVVGLLVGDGRRASKVRTG